LVGNGAKPTVVLTQLGRDERCAPHFEPGFRTVPGLIRKQFIYAEDGWAGGVYLWKARADAEAFYAGPWLDGIRERYAMDPQIKYFHTTCVTDNLADEILFFGVE
jgi:hypothetical protein